MIECSVCGWRHTVPCGRDECPYPDQPDLDFGVLVADHSEALKFVREMSIQPCPHWCVDDCLACRAKAWLHEARK